MRRRIIYAILLFTFTLTQTGCFFQALPHVTKALVDTSVNVAGGALANKVKRDEEAAWKAAVETAKAKKAKKPSVYEKLIPITPDDTTAEEPKLDVAAE